MTSELLKGSTPVGTSSARLSGDALVGVVQLHAASPLAHGLDDGELAGALDGGGGLARSGLSGSAEGGAGEDGGDHFDYDLVVVVVVVVVVCLCDVTRKVRGVRDVVRGAIPTW